MTIGQQLVVSVCFLQFGANQRAEKVHKEGDNRNLYQVIFATGEGRQEEFTIESPGLNGGSMERERKVIRRSSGHLKVTGKVT